MKAPIDGTIVMDKGDIVKTIYKHLIVDHTRTQETAWSRMIGFGVKCGYCKKGHLRE